jgi:hypothetical protein
MRRAVETELNVTKTVDAVWAWQVYSKGLKHQTRQPIGKFRKLEHAITFAACYRGMAILRKALNRVNKRKGELEQEDLFTYDGSDYHERTD